MFRPYDHPQGSILRSLQKLQFETLGHLLRYVELVLWQHDVCCV